MRSRGKSARERCVSRAPSRQRRFRREKFRDALAAHVATGDRRKLAAVLEACRVGRLTRNQHILLRLGELIAHAEAAAARHLVRDGWTLLGRNVRIGRGESAVQHAHVAVAGAVAS